MVNNLIEIQFINGQKFLIPSHFKSLKFLGIAFSDVTVNPKISYIHQSNFIYGGYAQLSYWTIYSKRSSNDKDILLFDHQYDIIGERIK